MFIMCNDVNVHSLIKQLQHVYVQVHVTCIYEKDHSTYILHKKLYNFIHKNISCMQENM